MLKTEHWFIKNVRKLDEKAPFQTIRGSFGNPVIQTALLVPEQKSTRKQPSDVAAASGTPHSSRPVLFQQPHTATPHATGPETRSSPTLPTRTRSAPPPAGRSRLAAAVAPSRSHLRQPRSIERRNPWPPRRSSSGLRRWRIHPFHLPDAWPR